MTIVIFFGCISTEFYIYIIYNKKGEKMNNIDTLSRNHLKELYQKERELRTSMSKLTHEIKNPLAVCNGYLEMMSGKDNSSKEKYLTIVKEEIKRTLNVINDFSFFNKEKKLDLEEIDLSLLLEEIVRTTKPLLKMKNGNIMMIGKEELYLIGDYNRLKQCFMNLIKNAVESKENNILITIIVKSKKNHYQIKIKDNGMGMTTEEQSQIFQEYYTTKQEGTGLGVPYAKEIIELHNGTIEYVSKKNIGTTVTITIPKEKKS